MTILSALARLYERLAAAGDAPPRGYSMEKIGGEVVLDTNGRVLAIRDLRAPDEKGKLQPRIMAVPMAVIRSSNIKPNLLWDKTAYALGISIKKRNNKPIFDEKGKPVPDLGERVQKAHESFIRYHENLLAGSNDRGLKALIDFLHSWQPEMFLESDFDLDILDQNLVFHLDGDFDEDGIPVYIHQRSAAHAKWKDFLQHALDADDVTVDLLGERQGAIARLHVQIKNVLGADSSGAALVSFNLDAFTSYGKEQGKNAPVSESTAFAYGAALNALLARESRRNVRIGDTTVVFWAEVPDVDHAANTDVLLMSALAPDENAEVQELEASLKDIAKGRASKPGLHPDTRVYILGLAPNAARLAVRFWRPGTLGDFARNITRFWADLAQEPPAWKGPPAAWSLLYEVAAQRKAENIPSRLGGDLMRAVLTGSPYPRTLLSGVITRIRADHDVNARRVAIIAAVLRRNFKEEIPMSLDRDNPDPAYRLGRLFAVLEGIQQAAQGRNINATIRDRYFAAAMATPARVFPLLVKTATHHLSNLRKGDKGGLAHHFEAEMGEIWSGLEPTLPRSLNLEAQGRFVAGYHHQRWARSTDSAKQHTTEGAPA